MATKVKVEKFETINKAKIKGYVGHTRTGACTAKGKCMHARIKFAIARPKKAAKKSKVG